MADEPRYPENANYGCVDCGSDNHTTGDVAWCRVAQARAAEALQPLHYCDCDDPVMDVDVDSVCRRCGRTVNFVED